MRSSTRDLTDGSEFFLQIKTKIPLNVVEMFRRSPSSPAVVLLTIVFRVSLVAAVAFSDMGDTNGFTTSAEADNRNGGPQVNSEITPSMSTLFKSSAYASSENRSTVISTSLPPSVSDNQSATIPPLSYTFKSQLPKTNTKPLNLSEVLSSVSSSTVPVTTFWSKEHLKNGTEGLNSAFTATDDQFFTVTSYYADDNSTTGNGTALAGSGDSSLPLVAICVSASLGAFAVIVIITVICVCCHRRRKKRSRAASLCLQTRGESSNEYENLDNVTEFADVIPRRGNVRVYPDSSVGFHSRPGPMWLPRTHSSGLSSTTSAQQGLFDDYRLLNEYLLTLKRPLENYITNDSISEDLKSYMTNASSKIFDIIWQNTGSANFRRPRIVPPLRSFAYEILYSDVFILENFVSLHLQIANLLRVFPTNETEPIIRQCRRSLESVDALLKIGTENVSYTSLVKSGYNDVLLDANPLFRELLGQLTIVRLRLESYYLIDACVEPDDAWKSKLLDCLTEAESAITEAFSDVLQSSDDVEPETADAEQDFHQLLKSRLVRFRQTTDPVMPQVKRFLQGVNGNAAYYVSITLDEISHLTTNILDPAAAPTLPEYDELNPDFFYQNLPSIYDLPHRSAYSLPGQAEIDINLTGNSLGRDLGPLQTDDDDPYEESPGALNETLGDISDAYDDDCFEVSVDRMSPSCLEDVLTLYKNQSTDQLQRSIRVSFIGESGLDGGALSREFFFMTFNSLVGQPLLSHLLFEGSRGHLLPAIDHVLTDNKVYWFVGVLIAQAVNRGCRGLPGLCNAVRHFLSLGAKIKNIGQSLEKVTVEDIADGELRAVIDKVQKKESLTEEERTVFENWARDSNFSKVLNPTTELEAVQRIFAHYVFNSRMTQLQAISEGIGDVTVRNNQASEIDRMFPTDEKLTYDDFMSGILIEPSTKCQRKAHKYFKRFCEELYGGKVGDLTLEALLQFFSGAPYFVSMVGAQVRFAEPHERNALPVAHACASELILPTVHTDYASFKSALVKALEYSGTGFGIP